MKTVANLPLVWSQRRFSELSEADKATLREALGRVPCDGGDLRRLWPAVESGQIGVVTARLSDGTIALASFYEVQVFPDGSRNFHSVASLALRPEVHGWTEAGISLMDDMARHHGCVSLSMHTIREGLVKTLTERHGWHRAETVLRKNL